MNVYEDEEGGESFQQHDHLDETPHKGRNCLTIPDGCFEEQSMKEPIANVNYLILKCESGQLIEMFMVKSWCNCQLTGGCCGSGGC